MRKGPSSTEIAVVHRPRYDDWSFPKGKLGPGETFEECALREVREETNLVCRLGPELPFAQYNDNKGRPKIVRYWLMAVIDDPASHRLHQGGGADVGGCVDRLAHLPQPP